MICFRCASRMHYSHARNQEVCELCAAAIAHEVIRDRRKTFLGRLWLGVFTDEGRRPTRNRRMNP